MGYGQQFLGNRFIDVTFAQITSNTETLAVDVIGLRNHSFQVIAVGVNVIKIEGSLDGTNFSTVPIDDGATTGWAEGAGNTFASTANGTYTIGINDLALNFIRLAVVSIGTSVDAKYHGST